MKASDYWREVGAPKLRARKAEIGRTVTNTQIAAAVEEKSGKATTRQLFEMFLRGTREPYISQLVAICDKMDLDLATVIGAPTAIRQPAFRSQDGRENSAVSHRRRKTRTA